MYAMYKTAGTLYYKIVILKYSVNYFSVIYKYNIHYGADNYDNEL